MNNHELAAAIRKGHGMIRESRGKFLLDGCGCALGAAWVGTGRTEKERFALNIKGSRSFGEHMGVDEALASTVSRKHFAGIPRLAIADWLDTLDVAKPKDAQTFDNFLASVMVPVDIDTPALDAKLDARARMGEFNRRYL